MDPVFRLQVKICHVLVVFFCPTGALLAQVAIQILPIKHRISIVDPVSSSVLVKDFRLWQYGCDVVWQSFGISHKVDANTNCRSAFPHSGAVLIRDL